MLSTGKGLQYAILWIVSTIFSFSSFCQNNHYNEVSISSPTAASLGKYADIPVNYHTGIPQIGIPIYTVKEGPLSVPIALNYHAGGLKTMETASWVGAGWSLAAGGVITRTVQGTPDEKATSNISPHTHGHFSDYGFNSYYYFPDAGAPGGYNSYAAQIKNGNRDGEPDLFFFNFNGYSGKFFFSDDRTPVIVPEQDIKIEYNYPGSGGIASFTLTTPDGAKYYFGRTDNTTDVDPIEKTNPYSADAGPSGGQAISSWYLNKIISYDGMHTITFTYDTEDYGYFTLSTFPLLYSDNSTNEYKLLKNIVYGVRLSQINFSNGAVTFVPGDVRTDLNNATGELIDNVNTQAKSLGAIKITDNIGVCKKFDFTYSYFQDNTTNLTGYLSNYSIQTDKKRLKLDQVQEKSCTGGLSIPAYSFEYFGELVPRRLTFGQDHWGFYNGQYTNSKLIPTYTVDMFNVVLGANRDANWPAMRGGTLKKIIYPTGGYSEFEFEPNTTYISTNKYELIGRTSGSMGYDGNTAPFSWTKVLSGNYHEFYLTNSSAGGTAALSITNQTTGASGGLSANPGQTVKQTLSMGAGTYSFTVGKTNSSTGNGASGGASEWVSSPYSKDDTIGGLRIKNIFSGNGLNTIDTITSYTYKANNISSGILYSRPTYVQIFRNDEYKNYGYIVLAEGSTGSCSTNGCDGCDISAVKPYYKSPSPIRPMETTQGNHVGYNEVTVSQTGNGKTVYRYYGSNLWDNNHNDVAYRNVNPGTCTSDIPNFPAAPLPHEFMRGELKYEGQFTESGQLLREVYYTPEYQESTIKTPGLIIQSAGGHGSYPTYYTLTTARKTKVSTQLLAYAPGIGDQSVFTQTIYGSAFHNQPTQTIIINATGDTLKQKITYAADIRIAPCDTISSCQASYSNALTTYYSQYITAVSACSSDYCRSSAYNLWMANKSLARQAYISCRRNNFTNPTNAYATCIQNAKTAADATLKPILEQQQQFINATIENSNWTNSFLLNSSFSSYDFVTNPSGKVYLDKAKMIKLTAPSASFTAAATSGNNISLVTDSRYKDEASFKHSGGNPVDIVGKDGINQSFIWDYNNKLPIAQTINGSTEKTAYTSFEADGLGGWSLNAGATILNTGGITGKKSLNGGVTKTVPAGNYVAGVWSVSNTSVNGQSLTQTPVKVKGIWRYFEVALNNVSTVTVTGDNIDEVRLYPEGANMVSYTYSPLLGILTQDGPNSNITYNEYDSLGRLVIIRDEDKNIVNQYDYQYNVPTHNTAVYEITGITRCAPCSTNSAYNSMTSQRQWKNINRNSPTYGEFIWVDNGPGECANNAAWVNTATALRCVQANFQNTGEQQQEQIDMNPCSITYNQTRWITAGTNTTACPLPPACTTGNCTGNTRKCVNNVCEVGTAVIVSSVFRLGRWECTTKYCFSDGSLSTYSFVTLSGTSCPVGICALP